MADRLVAISMDVQIIDVETDRDDTYEWEAMLEKVVAQVLAEHMDVDREKISVVAEITGGVQEEEDVGGTGGGY